MSCTTTRLSFRGRRSRNPEPMNTGPSRECLAAAANLSLSVFLGSGFGAARRPGMTGFGAAGALCPA
jgi:hypothetical protein